MGLSDRQKDDLHRAVYEYLAKSGCPQEVCAGFAGHYRVDTAKAASSSSSAGSTLLEKKWTSVVRLQKKVMELEARCGELEKEVKEYGGAGGGGDVFRRNGGASIEEWIPRPPARCTLSGHRGPITRVLFHPVFSVVATASEDATIKIWDYESGEYERTLKGHTNAVNDIAFSGTGELRGAKNKNKGGASKSSRAEVLLASCSADLTVKLWDFTQTFECTKTMHGHDHNVSSVCFMGHEGDYDMNDHSGSNAGTPGGDGSAFLISSSRDQTIKVWETASGYCVRTLGGHTDWVRMVRIGYSSSYGGGGGTNASSPLSLSPAPSRAAAGGGAGSSHRTWLASASSDHTIRLWNPYTGECRHELRGEHEHVIECLAFSNEYVGKYITGDQQESAVSASAASQQQQLFLASGARDKRIVLWDCITGQSLCVLAGHDNWVRGLYFHPRGKFLISCSDDKTVRVWDLSNNNRNSKTIEAHSHFVTCLDFHHKSPYVATGSVDNTLKIWECR
eukprot:Nk52_evm75s164 gene=Nk52_evmTU75s164